MVELILDLGMLRMCQQSDYNHAGEGEQDSDEQIDFGNHHHDRTDEKGERDVEAALDHLHLAAQQRLQQLDIRQPRSM
eukprot:CAMPEP_0174698806 /NCGR_PEP_ID=MMETSP1094-20130205/4295_1 /TAXON_ID=156173 /ORGANISM="Chrysochromulina brevifilum, Strain UTEX LB 985" /LENGTH=77 /DNA_ID=CAMNT_0015896037 /DNA_START=353 /DNA_END=586 /DNA_ORIENTATION=+